MSKTFSKEDVASHKTATDLFIIVDDDVYDLTKFQDEHPGACIILLDTDLEANAQAGGKKILTRVAGKDASKRTPFIQLRRRVTLTRSRVLEVSQREYPQEIQGQAPGRLSRGQGMEGGREARCASTREEGSRGQGTRRGAGR